jgi:hypothetical protein
VFGKLSDSIDEREVVHTERARRVYRNLPFFIIFDCLIVCCFMPSGHFLMRLPGGFLCQSTCLNNQKAKACNIF